MQASERLGGRALRGHDRIAERRELGVGRLAAAATRGERREIAQRDLLVARRRERRVDQRALRRRRGQHREHLSDHHAQPALMHRERAQELRLAIGGAEGLRATRRDAQKRLGGAAGELGGLRLVERGARHRGDRGCGGVAEGLGGRAFGPHDHAAVVGEGAAHFAVLERVRDREHGARRSQAARADAAETSLQIGERTAEHDQIDAIGLHHIDLERVVGVAVGDRHEARGLQLAADRLALVGSAAKHGSAVRGRIDHRRREGRHHIVVAREARRRRVVREHQRGLEAHAAVGVAHRLEDRRAAACRDEHLAARGLGERRDGVADERGVARVHRKAEHFVAHRRASRGGEERRAVARRLRVGTHGVLAAQVGGDIDRKRRGVARIGRQRTTRHGHRHLVAEDRGRHGAARKAAGLGVAPVVVDGVARVRDQRVLTVEEALGERGELRRDIHGRAAELLERSLAGGLDLGRGGGVGRELDDERNRRRVAELAEDRDHLALRSRVEIGKRHRERKHREPLERLAALHDLELDRGVARVDEGLEELRHRVLARGVKALGGQHALARRSAEHADGLPHAVLVARKRTAAVLNGGLDLRGEVGDAAHAAAAAHGAGKALGHAVAIDHGRHVGFARAHAERRLGGGLREVGLADQHIVHEVADGLLEPLLHARVGRRGGAAVLRQRGGRGGDERGRDKHGRQRTVGSVNDGRDRRHRNLLGCARKARRGLDGRAGTKRGMYR
ncbi:MAG: hypothetical protein ACKOYN_08040 [Planctomycetota bacterium]